MCDPRDTAMAELLQSIHKLNVRGTPIVQLDTRLKTAAEFAETLLPSNLRAQVQQAYGGR